MEDEQYNHNKYTVMMWGEQYDHSKYTVMTWMKSR